MRERLDFRIAVASSASRDTLLGFSVAYEVELREFGFLEPYFAKIVGQANLNAMKLVYGDELAVRKGYRRRGIGKVLMESRLYWYSWGYLEPSVRDAFAIGRTDVDSKMVPLYNELGFEDTGIRDPVYPSRAYFVKPLVRLWEWPSVPTFIVKSSESYLRG